MEALPPPKHKETPHSAPKRETDAGDLAGGRDRIVLPESFLKEIGRRGLFFNLTIFIIF